MKHGELTDIMFISAPPREVFFSSVEEMMEWYSLHPERLALLKNVYLPCTASEGAD